MFERGHVFRRAFSWLPAQFASQSDAPVGAPRQFGSTEHLSIEAIAAFVDGELRRVRTAPPTTMRATRRVARGGRPARSEAGARRQKVALPPARRDESGLRSCPII